MAIAHPMNGSRSAIYLDGEFIGEAQSIEANVIRNFDIDEMIMFAEARMARLRADLAKYQTRERDYKHDARVALKVRTITNQVRKACEPLIGTPLEPTELEKVIAKETARMLQEFDDHLNKITIEGSFDPND